VARVGIITMSDGRDSVYDQVREFCQESEKRLARGLADRGHEVIAIGEPVGSNDTAVAAARRLADARPDLAVINIPVWAFPHFSMLAARELTGPLLLFCTIDPQYPGMVAMLAAAGGLDQIGRAYAREWGDGSDEAVLDRVEVHVRAGAAVRGLSGSTFGRVGGRPMGMYTAVANPDQWIERFGVDVEEIDQWEIVRRAGKSTPPTSSAPASGWRPMPRTCTTTAVS